MAINRYLLTLFHVAIATTAASAQSAQPPEIIPDAPLTRPVQLPDGSLRAYSTRFGKLFSRDSSNGRAWSVPGEEFDLPHENMGGGLSLLDADSEVHVILTHVRGEGRVPAVSRFIDLWHCRTFDKRIRWGKPQRIWEGYCGAVMDFKQLSSGLLVVPFAAWKKPGETIAPDTGSNYTTVVTSADGGQTWQLSPSKLTSPCHRGYNGNNYGAIEPTIVELKDGRVWMLMRTQTGFLYESYSEDGIHWEEAKPSKFHSSTSPAALVRLKDDRIVVIWNNCEQPPKHDGAGVYGGRDALHAAISDDEGKTWRGFREIYRDPHRNVTPPKRGDRGTAYPQATALGDGTLLVVSGQGGRRAMIRLDPDWLLETRQLEPFRNRSDNWHLWKPFGPASGYWRDRTRGPVMNRTTREMGPDVLHVRKRDDKAPDCAIWNFPASQSGKIRCNIRVPSDSQGASLAFTNRFFNPVDARGESESAFLVRIGIEGNDAVDVSLAPDRWHRLEMSWDLQTRKYVVRVDDRDALRGRTEADLFGGVSYLRIRSLATRIDTRGILVEPIELTQ
jgi:hypothetical protein